jgi:hypothetical protein
VFDHSSETLSALHRIFNDTRHDDEISRHAANVH